MPLIISDETLDAAHLSKEEMLVKIALTLYAGERFTVGQAAHFAGLSRMEFQRCAADRRIPVHYNREELDEDRRTFAHLQRHHPHKFPPPSPASSRAV
jgi:predicted HTH domain antitoxin